MKYRILVMTKGCIEKDLPNVNDKYEAWCVFHYWQRANNTKASLFLLADNVIILGSCSKLEKNAALKYLGLKRPGLIKMLAVKLYYKIVYLF